MDGGPSHAVFLRAVNLGATRKAPSAKLKEIFQRLGFRDVATFRTSGNVVFRGSGSNAKLRPLLEKAPSAAARKGVMALGSDADRLAVNGTELYWLPSAGSSSTSGQGRSRRKARPARGPLP